MSWLTLVLGVAIIWGAGNLIDKFVSDHEVGDPFIEVGLAGLVMFTIFTAAAFYNTSTSDIFSHSPIIPIITGVIYTLAIVSYYAGIKREEVSRFIPVLSLVPVIITIFAFFFLGESFSWPVYIGIFMTVFGAVLISLEDPLHHITQVQSKVAIFLGLLCSILIAARDVIFKFLSNDFTFWFILFWVGIGGLFTVLIFLIAKSKKLTKSKKGFVHLLGMGAVKAIGYLLFAQAITIGPVSLVAATLKVKSLLVFFGSTLISKYHPEIIHEKLDKKILFQKITATLIIISGVMLIKLFSI